MTESSDILAMLNRVSNQLEALKHSISIRTLSPKMESKYVGLINAVSSAFDVGPKTLTGRLRTDRASKARHAAFFIMRNHLGMTLEQIGLVFGRCHQTVMHGCKTAKNMIDTDPNFRKQLNAAMTIWGMKNT